MFNKDFYPTPQSVIEQMMAGVDLLDKKVLEPSAGSGNIVDYLKLYGADVTACEINDKLAQIVSSKCRFLKPDFMQVRADEISHLDMIVMNPPFSADERHILHAWEIAPEGCEIISLCNWNTICNDSYSYRKQLKKVIDDHGNSQNLGEVFAGAERTTNASIGLVRLFKPRTSEQTEFEGYFDMTEEEERQENGIMAYSEVRNIVNRYVGAVRMFNEVVESSERMNQLINPISNGLNIKFGAHYTGRDNIYHSVDRDTFKKQLQKSAWKSVFAKMNMGKYVTQRVISDLNAFIEKQSNVPFTVTNVYKMIEMIAGTHVSRLNSVLVEAFERICGYSHQNSTGGEGWKTNSDYKVNRRFIHPYVCDSGYNGMVHIRHDRFEQFDDIVKALCLLTGQKYEDQISLYSFFQLRYKIQNGEGKFLTGYDNWDSDYERLKNRLDRFKDKEDYKIVDTGQEWGKWGEWGFFRVRGYKKGTMHFEFKDEKVWELFNRKVAEIKGWSLPKQTDTKRKGTERTRKQGVEVYNN